MDGHAYELTYEHGAVVTLRLVGQDAFELAIANPPPRFTGFRLGANLPFSLNEGGTWTVDDAAPVPFPKEKPAQPTLRQGPARSLALAGGQGGDLAWTYPAGTFLQLQDNRAWNWPIFHAFAVLPAVANAPVRVGVRLTAPEGSTPRVIAKLVDRFGQDFESDFEGKMKDEAEFAEDARTDAAYYARFGPAQPVDRFGSPPAGEALGLEKTGFFRLHRFDDGRWTLVNPDGNPFFHLGVCSFNMTEQYTNTARQPAVYAWLPPREGDFASAWHPNKWQPDVVSFYAANWVRKFGKPFDLDGFHDTMIPRVRAFGFNAFGAFNSPTDASRKHGMPLTRTLPLREDRGKKELLSVTGPRGYFDPFDAGNWATVDARFARSVANAADDPLTVGWYIGNEPIAQDAPRMLGALPADRAAKRELADFLRQRYNGDLAAFNAAWNLAVAGWDGLAAVTLAPFTKAASDDLNAFAAHFFEAFYAGVAERFRRADPNHLLLGHRFQKGTANVESVIRAVARHNDVVSINYYADAFDRVFLDRVRGWAGDKPMLFSEFHFTAPSESGLPGGARIVDSQAARGAAYRHYVEQAAALGYVVGVEWFTLTDMARTARFFDSEKCNCGLFSVVDRPWKKLLEAAAATNHGIYEVASGRRAPFVYDHPLFTGQAGARREVAVGRAVGAIRLDGTRAAWPAVPTESVTRLVSGADAGGVSATFLLAWDDTHLHAMVDVVDPTPMKNGQAGENLWRGDGVELFIAAEDLDAAGGLRFGDRHLLIGAAPGENGAARVHVRNLPAGQTADVRAAVFPRDGGYAVQAAIPYAALGIEAPRGGERLLFDLAVDDSENGGARARQFLWNGTAAASNDRGVWGRAQFVR